MNKVRCVWLVVPLLSAGVIWAQDREQKVEPIPLKSQQGVRRIALKRPPGKKEPYAIERKRWYLKVSSLASYYEFGSEFKKAISDFETLFAGKEIDVPIAIFRNNFSMQSDKPIKRASTNIVPTFNMGFGILLGERHQIETDIGVAGLVTLNTLNTDTSMVLTEKKVCAPANLDDCPLAKLGFVDASSGKGNYDLKVRMNEQVWMVTPSLYYDFILLARRWGRLSVGTSGSLLFFSSRQKLEFNARRIDPIASEPLKSRKLEGRGTSAFVGEYGGVGRLYLGFRRALKGSMAFDMRAGASYGFINVRRDVDGNSRAILGDQMQGSSPISSLGIKNQEQTGLQLTGVFVQLGLVF